MIVHACSHEAFGGFTREVAQQLTFRPLDEIHNAVSRVHIPLIPSLPSPDCCSPSCSASLCYAPWLSALSQMRKIKVLSAVSYTANEAGHSLTFCHVLPWASLGTKLYCFGGWITGKSKLFLPSPMIPISDFFAPTMWKFVYWTSVLKKYISWIG